VRTRVIDDWVADAVSAEASQVVLLGAGLDSRAYRLPDLRQLLVFEVDHPATLGAKRTMVDRHVPSNQRNHVRFVPVDLTQHDLDEALRAAGFRNARTVVVWEGVTSYLNAAAVDATIAWFARNTAAGSRLIFTYLDARAIHTADGSSTKLADTFSGVGEPMTFGIDPDGIAGYLAERDLELIEDLSMEDAAGRYLYPLGRRDRAGTYSHIAVANNP
jgi:methyltransferase (TIGR00027 family)